MIYISHPYGGNPANLKAVEAIVERLAEMDYCKAHGIPFALHCGEI